MKKGEIIKTGANSLILDEVQQYIYGTLLFTPRSSIEKRDQCVEIKARKKDSSINEMKIWRRIDECVPHKRTPEGTLEFAFLDEVYCLTENKADSFERWAIRFSIYLDKETLKFHSIDERPDRLENVFSSLKVFDDLSKIEGSRISAGDFEFVSNGKLWELQDTNKLVIPAAEIKSLIPWIEK